MSYLDLSIKELHEALVKKEVTPLELVEEALKRAHSNQDNAFEFIDDEGAKAFASSLTVIAKVVITAFVEASFTVR